jgi:hypothetical protein
MQKIELPTVKLYEALASVVPAASTSEKDPPFNGVSIEATPELLTLQATNGHWLARYTIDVDEPIADLSFDVFSAFVPIATIKKWLALIEDVTDGTSSIVRDAKLVRATFSEVGHVDWTVGAVEVIFPVSVGIWPSDPPHAVESTKIDFRRMAPVARAFEAAGSDGSDMRSEFRGPMRPVLVTSESAPALTALVMPCATKEERETAKREADERQLDMFDPTDAPKRPGSRRLAEGETIERTPTETLIDKLSEAVGAPVTVVPGGAVRAVGEAIAAAQKAKKLAKKAAKSPEKKRSHHKKVGK